MWSFLPVCLNESWWRTSNGGLWDFSLKCLRSLLWMVIFLSTAPLPATCLTPGFSQLWLYVYLSVIAQIILCSSQSSDNCQVHIQLIPNPWRPAFHSPHAVILLALQQFSYLYASHTYCPITFLTSSMEKPLKWELMVLGISLAIHPAACKKFVGMNESKVLQVVKI